MRFIIPADEERLNTLVVEGVFSREALEKAVGDKSVVLIEAMVAHHQVIPIATWITWGLQQGLARLNRTKVTLAFIRDCKFSEAERSLLFDGWVFPFAKNAHNQLLVASAPGWPVDTRAHALFGENPIFCVATLPELEELRATYAKAW